MILRNLVDLAFVIVGVLMIMNHHRVTEVLIERRRNVALNRTLGFRYGPAQFRVQDIVVIIGGAGFVIGGIADFFGYK